MSICSWSKTISVRNYFVIFSKFHGNIKCSKCPILILKCSLLAGWDKITELWKYFILIHTCQHKSLAVISFICDILKLLGPLKPSKGRTISGSSFSFFDLSSQQQSPSISTDSILLAIVAFIGGQVFSDSSWLVFLKIIENLKKNRF